MTKSLEIDVISTQRKIKNYISQNYAALFGKSRGNRCLIYHSIKQSPESIFDSSEEQFRNHISFLKKNNFNFLSTDSEFSEASTLSISFDDGLLDNLKFAAPILVENKIPFTVFVSSSFILEGCKNYLSIRDLKELALLPGVTIGAHGHRHVPLATLPATQIREELRISKMEIENMLGRKINSLSYPHGSTNQLICNEVKNIGYEKAYSSFVGANFQHTNPFQLKRNEMNSHDGIQQLQIKLLGGDDWLYPRQLYKL